MSKSKFILYFLLSFFVLTAPTRSASAGDGKGVSIWNYLTAGDYTEGIGVYNLVSMPKLLVEYATLEAEIVTVGAQLVAARIANATGVEGASIMGTTVNVDKVAIITGGESVESLTQKYVSLRQRKKTIEEQLQRELHNAQAVANAVQGVMNGQDILSSLSTTFRSLSPYIKNAPEVANLMDFVREYYMVYSSGYKYFASRAANLGSDPWHIGYELASDMQMFQYLSSKLEDDWVFLMTEVLSPKDENSVSQEGRLAEIRRLHDGFRYKLDMMYNILQKRISEDGAAELYAGVDGRIKAAWLPQITEDAFTISKPEELNMEDRTLAQEVEYQTNSSVRTLDEVKSDLGNLGSPILNFISAIIGLLALAFTVRAAAKVQKGEGQHTDALLKVWVGTFIAILAMQIIRLMFFNSI